MLIRAKKVRYLKSIFMNFEKICENRFFQKRISNKIYIFLIWLFIRFLEFLV